MIRLSFDLEPRPGELVRGDIRIPEGPPPRGAVVVVHGFKGYKDWGFYPWLAQRIAGAGYAAITFNFARNGIGDDPNALTEFDRFGSNTFSFEQDELRLVLARTLDGDLLPRRPRQVALLGHSRGGGQVVLAAAAEERTAALVTWGSVSYFDRWTQETKEQWREDGTVWVLDRQTGRQLPVDVALLEDFEARRAELDVRAAAARVQAPWLILHARDDMSVWPGEAEALAAANPGARLHLVENAGHTFEVGHPFREPTPSLIEATDRTLAHLRAHMGT